MQGQGHRPDVGVYNVVIEALTRSGVLSAQLKAAQIFQAATRQGQLRCGAASANLPLPTIVSKDTVREELVMVLFTKHGDPLYIVDHCPDTTNPLCSSHVGVT